MLGWFWIFAILASWAVVGGLLSALLSLLGWTFLASYSGSVARNVFFLSLFPLTISALLWGVSKLFRFVRAVFGGPNAQKPAVHSLPRRRASF